MKAIRINNTGSPEVITYIECEKPKPSVGSVCIKNMAIGLNYIDTYHRTGLYPVSLPTGLGLEGAGIVEELGQGVDNVNVGDRVAYVSGPIGAYAEYHCVNAQKLIKLPDFISYEVAASLMLKAMTVRYLFKDIYSIQSGETIVFHAAAGGVGSIALAWAKAVGTKVIATVGGEKKCDLVKAKGADYVIDYNRENVAEKVKEITDGKGVPVVYDGIGAASLQWSLDSLARRGLLVSFGNASGAITNFDFSRLAAGGSLSVIRPTLADYIPDLESLHNNANDVFDMIKNKHIDVQINATYSLKEAKQAHIDLEKRKLQGLNVISP